MTDNHVGICFKGGWTFRQGKDFGVGHVKLFLDEYGK